MPHILYFIKQIEHNWGGARREGVPWSTNISKSLSVTGLGGKRKWIQLHADNIRTQARTGTCDANRVNGMLGGPNHERLRPGSGCGPKVKAPGESYRPAQSLT